MSQECLRTGDKALVHFRFIKHPEYIRPGQRMVFREGRTKAVGNVLSVMSQSPSSLPVRGKTQKMKQNNSSNTIIQVRLQPYSKYIPGVYVRENTFKIEKKIKKILNSFLRCNRTEKNATCPMCYQTRETA